MAKSIYLINPKESFPGYFGLEVSAQVKNGLQTLVADLTTTTLAAMVPPDWHVKLCDERIQAVDADCGADVVGITGKITQRNRMIELAAHCRSRGKLVIIGGSYASLSPDDMRPHCDILMVGEAEEIAPQIFADLASGQWRDKYVGGKVDLSLSPVPRWDLYPKGAAVIGAIQTSRGCPFECEFCDVIQYVGRKQRHKSIDQILRELDRLYAHGYRGVFLADDNFTVFRKRTKALLRALIDWNRAAKDGPVEFSTQVSIDAGRDDALLEIAAEAGLRKVFIGIETPNEDSLRETKKRQNLNRNLTEDVRNFVAHGVAVTGGIIVGFDSDGPDIFEMQRNFIDGLPVPILSVGTLVAPDQTPLKARLRAEGRLIESDLMAAANPFYTNIIPKQMSRQELLDGVRALCLSVYSPAAIERRVMGFIATFQSRTEKPRPAPHQVRIRPWYQSIFRTVMERGAEEKDMYRRVIRRLQTERSETVNAVLWDLARYGQVRHMFHEAKLAR